MQLLKVLEKWIPICWYPFASTQTQFVNRCMVLGDLEASFSMLLLSRIHLVAELIQPAIIVNLVIHLCVQRKIDVFSLCIIFWWILSRKMAAWMRLCVSRRHSNASFTIPFTSREYSFDILQFVFTLSTVDTIIHTMMILIDDEYCRSGKIIVFFAGRICWAAMMRFGQYADSIFLNVVAFSLAFQWSSQEERKLLPNVLIGLLFIGVIAYAIDQTSWHFIHAEDKVQWLSLPPVVQTKWDSFLIVGLGSDNIVFASDRAGIMLDAGVNLRGMQLHEALSQMSANGSETLINLVKSLQAGDEHLQHLKSQSNSLLLEIRAVGYRVESSGSSGLSVCIIFMRDVSTEERFKELQREFDSREVLILMQNTLVDATFALSNETLCVLHADSRAQQELGRSDLVGVGIADMLSSEECCERLRRCVSQLNAGTPERLSGMRFRCGSHGGDSGKADEKNTFVADIIVVKSKRSKQADVVVGLLRNSIREAEGIGPSSGPSTQNFFDSYEHDDIPFGFDHDTYFLSRQQFLSAAGAEPQESPSAIQIECTVPQVSALPFLNSVKATAELSIEGLIIRASLGWDATFRGRTTQSNLQEFVFPADHARVKAVLKETQSSFCPLQLRARLARENDKTIFRVGLMMYPVGQPDGTIILHCELLDPIEELGSTRTAIQNFLLQNAQMSKCSNKGSRSRSSKSGSSSAHSSSLLKSIEENAIEEHDVNSTLLFNEPSASVPKKRNKKIPEPNSVRGCASKGTAPQICRSSLES